MTTEKKTILIINHYQSSDRHGYSSRYGSLGKYWRDAGCNVIIVSASFSHLYVAPPKVVGLFDVESVDGIEHYFLRTPKYHGNGIGRTINMAVFVIQLMLFIPYFFFRLRPDCVIASSVYLFDTIPALLLAKLSGGSFVREIRDLWPLTLVELGLTTPDSLKSKLLNWTLGISVRNADVVVSTLPFAYLHFEELGISYKKFGCIPQCAIECTLPMTDEDLARGHKFEIDDFRSRFKFLVGFTGTLGNGDTLPTLIESAKLLKGSGIGFVIVGEGANREDYQSLVHLNKIDNVIFLPKTSRRGCAVILGLMDCLYMGWESKQIYRFGISPNRLIDYMLSAKPIVHARDYGNDPVAEAGCGVSVPSADPVGLAKGIQDLCGLTEEEREVLGQRALSYVKTVHDGRVLAHRYLSLMRFL